MLEILKKKEQERRYLNKGEIGGLLPVARFKKIGSWLGQGQFRGQGNSVRMAKLILS